MFIRERQIIYKDDMCIVTVNYIESDSTVHFDVKDPISGDIFVVHVSPKGVFNIHYFPKANNISKYCSQKGIVEICKVYVANNIQPRINIVYTNKPLIAICTCVGFRKVKNIKHLYVLKKLKEI